jgi:hypothetical protein
MENQTVLGTAIYEIDFFHLVFLNLMIISIFNLLCNFLFCYLTTISRDYNADVTMVNEYGAVG